jgi:5-methylcytosine-specific restriction endonuclease McrBC GTP-binding regulatory subunit McrB
MAGQGFVITAGELANFYLALLVSPLVIMTGISGTGKSRLPRLFAEFIGAPFTSIPVKPQWDDNSDLFGYTSNLNQGAFVEGEVTEALQAAAADLATPSFVLLDEMNLAAVEHYFSDFLSVIETRRRAGGAIVTDTLPIDLPYATPGEEDRYARLRSLYLPHNVRVVGTANMDETTRNFSPKVLDRAFSIEFNEVDLTAFPMASSPIPAESFRHIAKRLVDPQNPVTVGEGYKDQAQLFDDVAGLIEEVRTILEPARLSFGYRPRDAACLYMWHWKKDKLEALLPYKTALDNCILQKVLPKIYGQGERLRDALKNLEAWLQGEPIVGLEADSERQLLRSAEKVKRMRQRLEEEGATTYWGT